MTTIKTDYEKQASEFMSRWEIEFKAKRGADKCSPFCDGKHIHGDQYRVSLRRPIREGADGHKLGITFPFWNSLNDSQAGKEPTAYDVLCCCGSDLSCPDTFEEFCAEYGYDTDSIKAAKQFRVCLAFSQKLQRFFDTEEMQTELQAIN